MRYVHDGEAAGDVSMECSPSRAHSRWEVRLALLQLDRVDEKNRLFNCSETCPQWKNRCAPPVNTAWRTISRWVLNEVSVLGLLGLLFCFYIMGFRIIVCYSEQGVEFDRLLFLIILLCFSQTLSTCNNSWIQIYLAPLYPPPPKKRKNPASAVKHCYRSCCDSGAGEVAVGGQRWPSINFSSPQSSTFTVNQILRKPSQLVDALGIPSSCSVNGAPPVSSWFK